MLIDAVFLLPPYLWLLVSRRLRGMLALKALGVFVLGRLEGAMGWYMEKRAGR